MELEFVSLGVATTGGGPARERLAALAALRVACQPDGDGGLVGRSTGRFEAALNPGRRVPGGLARAARLSADELDAAPTFDAVAEELREFLGDRPVVAADARLVLDLLGRELARAGRLGLDNPVVDLADLADLAGLAPEKPSLSNLAATLGLAHPAPGEPRADARTAARVAVRLLARVADRGIGDLADLLRALDRPRPPGALRVGVLLPEPPDGPGVYYFKAADGSVLYVGKATSLRRRLRSYLLRPLRYERGLVGLTEATAEVAWEPAPSELVAELLEAQAIRAHLPRYNVQRRRQPGRRYLRLDWSQPFPRLELRGEAPADGALYLGPFPGSAAARAALDLANAVFALRTCTRALAWPRRRREPPPCALLAAERCLGPCTGRIEPDAYRARVQGAVGLLVGQRDASLDELTARLAERAARGDRRGSEATRALLRRVRTFEPPSHPLPHDALAGAYALLGPLDATGRVLAHVFRSGRLVACLRLDAGDEPQARLARVLGSAPPFADLPLEQEQEIVRRWLARRAGEVRLVRLPESPRAAADDRD